MTFLEKQAEADRERERERESFEDHRAKYKEKMCIRSHLATVRS
jgi:hypothetical protein